MEEEIAENIIQIIVLGTLGLFTFFGGVLTFIILYQKKTIRSQKEKQELATEFQKDLLHNFIDTQESERKRIAADLHDNVGAALAAVKMMMNRLKPIENSEKELLIECKDIVQRTADSTRQISHNLLPPSLETLGLKKVIERMAKNVSSADLKMNIKMEAELKLSQKIEIGLFRITQELMTNSLKYAKANMIQIKIELKDNLIYYTYSDNGIGFNTFKSEGLGFKNIATRVEMLRGDYKFYSIPNKESGINLNIPY